MTARDLADRAFIAAQGAGVGGGERVPRVVTWTPGGNEGMRAVNQRLGFTTRDVSLTMTAPLPLEV